MTKLIRALLVWLLLMEGLLSIGLAGEQRSVSLKQYWGIIASVRIDRCGKRPGLCEGALILTRREGDKITLAIRPGTWIKRGERLVLLEELSVGDSIHVQAIEFTGEGGMRATVIEMATPP